MEHITKEYGRDVNYMRITGSELEQLEPFLRALGVRMRAMVSWKEGDEWMHEVQADNPYKTWANLYADCAPYVKKQGDAEMTDDRIASYQR